MLHFHYCQNYINNTEPEIDSIVKKYFKEYSNRENLKGIGKIAPFTKGIFVFKIKTPYAEIILEEKNIEINNEILNVYFVRGFKNGLQDYVEIRDGKWTLYNELQEDEIEKFKTNFIINNIVVEHNTNQPPQTLLNWQNEYKLRVDYDIYETEEWVKFAMNNSSDEGMKSDETKLYLLTLKEVLSENKLLIKSVNKGDGFETFSVILNDIGILYTKVLIDNNSIYILHNGGNIKTQTAHWNNVMKFRFDKDKKFSSLHDVSSVSLKAYPGWTLNNPDLWTKIEKNNELGNLSLLPEQTEFLKNFKFPKYINGQAGSGKSTMLYYLFANVYYYKYAGEITGDVIFLTENEKLLEHTKASVYDLLLHNPEFDLSSEDIAIVNVDKHFHPFKNFLLSLLPDDNELFSSDKYLNFSKFKLLYEQSKIATHIKNKFSAELVWFTLSTYVFGNSLDCQITSDNYLDEMPKEGKELISLEDLKGIEKEIIFPFYNKLLNEENYWDKIKLIKFINNNISITKSYDVIFCDEAQDFSRVELDFIMKLSSYAKFNLSNVEQFPIVFAGDALQTVNPTGFRSEALTAMIYNELTNSKTGYKLDASTLEFTPTYNYRSSQAIVNVANAIQNYRKQEFSANIKQPQTSKRPVVFENEHLNVFVDFDDFANDESLQRKIEFKTIIVPVNYDEIESYKETNPILKNFENIISAVDAKGLDFSEVVIYGFGDYIINKNSGVYESRYLYNKLYVAVTRAQAELVIIDSSTSKEGFWKPLIYKYLKSDWANQIKPKPTNFEEIIIFDSGEIIQSSSNILENDANRQKDQGVLEKNIPLLQVASSHFIKLGNKKEYYICLAKIEEIKDNWKKASEYYLKKEVGAEGVEMAISSLWTGQLWIDLVSLNVEIKNPKQQLILTIAKLFIEKSLSESSLNILYDNLVELSKLLNKTIWRKQALKLIADLLVDEFDSERIGKIAEILTENCHKGDENILEQVGNKYFTLKKYQLAIDAFERANIEKENYLKSKLELAKKKGIVEEIIIYQGRIVKDTDCDKEEIANEIVSVYIENNLEEKVFKNIYVNLYAYMAFIVVNNNDVMLLEISRKVEKSFSEKGRQVELADFYSKLIVYNNIDNSMYNFIIERWAKNNFEAGIDIETINKDYQVFSKLKKSKYIPFTITEIENIKKFPDQLKKIKSEHLSDIEISNFRKFQKLEIKNLGLVNLIVGDNNIGKTSLLEALLFTEDKKDYLERLAFSYIDRINIHPDKSENSEGVSWYFNLNKSFLNDYERCSEEKENIGFRVYNNRFFSDYQIKFDENLNGNEGQNIISYDKSDFLFLNNLPYDNGVKMPFIAYGKGFGQELASVYDKEIRSNRSLESIFLANLKLFIPNVESVYVRLDGSIDIRDRDYVVDRPLHQYGEGANKLFRILLLLTLHKGKRLLIDEIDAGIHFSRFKEFWRILLNIAKKDNTQIIATTHNDECIQFFTDVLNEDDFGAEYQKLSRVVQMKFVNKLKVRSFEFESFNLAFEDGVELRGGE
ncbi:AAA family ATPase [Flavobacterium difficile]|uniref:AAA family ATPase n=1 Tax=Flavobacterium difficile TaxID=2709659 RepID=A0ABX0I993_9FLAO|nr:AAA family ATPase [Flavobacterium difficile]NHM02414.1 AAA family ATPase [Flavobacterium difficile]